MTDAASSSETTDEELSDSRCPALSRHCPYNVLPRFFHVWDCVHVPMPLPRGEVSWTLRLFLQPGEGGRQSQETRGRSAARTAVARETLKRTTKTRRDTRWGTDELLLQVHLFPYSPRLPPDLPHPVAPDALSRFAS